MDNLTEIGQISDLGYLGFTGSLMHVAIKRSNVSTDRSDVSTDRSDASTDGSDFSKYRSDVSTDKSDLGTDRSMHMGQNNSDVVKHGMTLHSFPG